MLTYRIDSGRGVMELTGTGHVTSSEIATWQAEVRSHPDFDPALAVLADFRGASLSKVASTEVRRHAENDPFGPTSPHAIVVADDADYGVARMFEAYCELAQHKGPVRAFRDPESAWAWIEEVRGSRG
jgi:hypothetical protein